MSPRARSWLGAVLFAVGVFAFFAGALFPGLSGLAYAGIAAVAGSVALVVWALVDVGRQIGRNQAVFEARLRSETEKRKDSTPPAI